MSARLTAWIVGALALIVALQVARSFWVHLSRDPHARSIQYREAPVLAEAFW